MAYSWGSHMCSYEPQQFVRPYCDGETVKVGLYGADSTCSSQNESVAPIEPDLDLCYERDWWSKIYGPWHLINNNKDPWETVHKYKLECSPGGAVRIRHYWNCPNLRLNLTYEWPEGLCMDASDAACEDWDPARWVTVRSSLYAWRAKPTLPSTHCVSTRGPSCWHHPAGRWCRCG